MKLRILLITLCLSGVCLGQNIKPLESQDDYEPNAAYPFGRLNPEAPPETKQFDFMIGAFDCNDRIFNPAVGKWFDMKARRGAKYVLNGNAIQDQNYTNILTSTNIRIFDPSKKEWVVSYFKAPFGIGVWRGRFKDGEVSLWQGDKKQGSKLSFFDIKDDEYSWKAEGYKDGVATKSWEFTCKRRKG